VSRQPTQTPSLKQQRHPADRSTSLGGRRTRCDVPITARAQAILDLGILFSTNVTYGTDLRSMDRVHLSPHVLYKQIDEGVVPAPEICIVKPAWLTIAVWSATNLGIDMSKPRLRLIHCSNGVRPSAKHRQHGRSFRPLVLRGSARAISVPSESSWDAALKLIDLGFLIFHVNYFAFLQASITVLEAHNWTAPEKAS
jgi:hypothetical protein